jgi:hypothetical protein
MWYFHFMAGLNGEQVQIFPYDPSRIDFVSPIKIALGLEESDELSRLHEKFKLNKVVIRDTDSTTAIHHRYYENIGKTDFQEQYRRFVQEVVAELVSGPLIVQKVPSFRVHLPANKAVGQYHRDRDFGHQAGAINFWIPVTDAYYSNTVHVVRDEGQAPTPINVNFGEALAFDAVNLLHGNELNSTGSSRVSFDFRVIPETDYVDSREISVNTLSRLAIGGYYSHAENL